ncbi:tandem-95 repeat protein [Luteolibacter arcticus]|uniref:Tandem-95 repeat protein n=1 Tax=Luteolibacter arcticus TaxID=1581411 RepID=A0ABT3GNC1_9BACT|nr:tandem-95 repeat protein [Luteolibacter arcticus]MCW1925012.1 tandem-95 repeat protein [Luteolibacter arcticus]
MKRTAIILAAPVLLVTGVLCYLSMDSPPAEEAAATKSPAPRAKAIPAPGAPAVPRGERAAAAAPVLEIPELAALSEWQARWQSAEPDRRPTLLEEGLRLAAARKPVMAELMRTRPEEALQAALTWSQWAALPEAVRTLTERPFSMTANYDVLSDCRPAEERNREPRHLTWLGTAEGSLKVHPWSGWKDVTSKSGLPVQGIRLEDEVVLRSGVFQLLDAADAAAVAGLLPSRKDDAGLQVTALVGGERVTFPDTSSVNVIAGELTAALLLNGPHTVEAGLAIAFSSSSGQAGSIIGGASAASLAWSATPKRVLALRLDFADAIGAVFTEATLEARLASASARLESMSYGVTRLSTMTATPQVLRLPRTRAQYQALPSTSGPLADDALVAAVAAGYVLADYDIFIFSAIPTGDMTGAFANVGGSRQWVTGQSDYGTFLHELGHNYGLNHANAWVGNQAGGDWTERNGFVTQYGPAANDEYNDVFDAMGNQHRTAPGSTWVTDFGDFSMDSKVCLGWMQPAAVADATASGIYRVHRFDHADAADDPNRKLALSFRTADGQRIWAGLRRNYVNNPLLGTSAYLVWANSVNGHRQIDCTPFSRINAIPGNGYDAGDLDREDAGLPTGVTWTAPDGSVRLTNLGFGGVAPNEYLDLQVELLPAAAAYDLFTTAALTTPGLTGSYFNSGLRAVNQSDWTASQVSTGTRVDAPPHFPSAGWGSRAAVGVTGGTDADWNNFSVQWDGYVRINRTTRLATKSDDGSRMWIDTNANDAFEAGELLNNGWGTGQAATVGQYSAALPAGNYKVRIQYEEGGGGNSFQLVHQGEGDFEIYQDEQLQTYGLNASFVNASLRNVAAQADWTTTQAISGNRADPIPLYLDNGMGVRNTVGITGGSDGDWRNFSVQYDGYLKVLRRTRFINYGAGGARFWIDTNDDGNFGAAAPEYTPSNWGQNGNARFGGFSGWVEPGDYRVRVQQAVEQDGNRFGLLGQNDRQVHDGLGLSLNGNGWVSAPAGAAVSGNFTVEAWVRPSQTAGVMTVFSTQTAAADFGFAGKISDGNEVSGRIGTANAWLNGDAWIGVNYRANEWMHVAYAVSGNECAIYVNGWKAGSRNFNGVPVLFDANHPPLIGRDARRVNEGFRGQMDEVRVWNTTRSGEQIASNYRRPVAANAPGLVSCWRFDDAAGAVPSDLVNARNGALNGDAALTDLETPVTPTPALIVNSLAASGTGSLQEALGVAAGLPGPVTINITVTDAATALQAYARNLNGGAANELVFAKTSGPAWLNVAANGTISGTPDAANAGANAFTLSVTNAAGTTFVVTLNIDAASADLAADLDGDGFTNGLEITLGTNPKLSASQPAATYANLRGWWKFDENSGTVADDSTGRIQDGAVSGATWTAGTAQGALSFDGADSVSTPSSLLSNRPAFTLSGCYKSSLANGDRIGLWGQDDAVEFGISGRSLQIWTPGGGSASTPLPSVGQWHHVTCVGDGTTLKIYIDGVLATTGGSATSNYGSSASPFRIGGGGIWDPTGNGFTGEIDDVRIYERALSAAEVRALHGTLVPNRAPVFTVGSLVANATEDLAFVGQLEASDSDYGDTRTYEKVGAAGWLQVAANGALSGTPDNSHVGLNNFTVRVRDAGGLTTDATLTVTVTNVNDAPMLSVVADQSINEDTATSAIAFTVGDVDTAIASLTVTGASSDTTLLPLANVVLGGSGANRTVTLTPAANQFGVSNVTLTVSDGTVTATDTFVLTVVPVNDLPLAVNDGSAGTPFATLAEDAVSSPLAVLANDSDLDLNPLTVTAANSPNGFVVINSGTTLTFTPSANFNGAATINYTISDGEGGSSNATVVVTVTAVNDAPTISLVADQSINEDTATSAIALTIGDVETAAASLTVTRASSDTTLLPLANVVLGGSGANRTVTLTPAANQFGTSAVTLAVSDGTATTTATFVLTVTPVNDLPLAVNDGSAGTPFATLAEDAVSSPLAVLANDSDVDLDTLTVTAATSSNGAVAINSGTTLIFTPDANFNGAATINYTISDGEGGSSNATVVVTVTPVNDLPVIDAVTLAAFQLAERDAISGEDYATAFAGIASDPEGESLTFTKRSGPGWLTVAPGGALTGTPAASDEAAATPVVIRATDPGGAWVEASFDLTVIVRRSLAVNYRQSTSDNTAVAAVENTFALNTAAAITGPVVWNNQAIDDAGNGPLANGRGTGSYSGVTVNSFSSVPYQRGSNALSGSDASQRVFRYYLDDSGGGGSYSASDSVGASIHLTGLQQFVKANRATSYTLTLLFNADSTIAEPFHDATVHSGVPSEPSADAIGDLPPLGTITAALLGDGKQPLPAVGTVTAGKRGWGKLAGLTDDSITISLPVSSGGKRGSIAGFILTPATDPQPQPQPQAQAQDGYAQWAGARFGEASTDPETAGKEADPNHDGVVNLLAYAMGIDPLAPPAVGATPAQRGHLELTKRNGTFHFDYQRDLTVSGVSLVIEESTDLGDASAWAPANVVKEILSEEGGIRTIRATYTPPPGDTRRFFRLRASQ